MYDSANDIHRWRTVVANCAQQGKWREADRQVEEALRHFPADGPLLQMAGNTAQMVGDLERAAERFRAASLATPGNAAVENQLGVVERQRGRLEDAIASFRRAVKSQPAYARAWNNLGAALIAAARKAEAEPCVREAIRLDPSNPYAHLNLGICLSASGNAAEGAACFQRSVQLKPDLVEAIVALGRSTLEASRFEEAETLFRRALAIAPSNAEALMGLAETLAELGQSEEAVSLYRRAAIANPEMPAAHFGAALTVPRICADNAQIEQIRKDLEKGLAALESKVDAWRRSAVAQPESILWSNFYVAYHGRNDVEIARRTAEIQRRFLSSKLPQFFSPLSKRPVAAGERIRVGFASQTFFDCTAGHYFRSWISQLDPRRFETFAYFLDWYADDVTREIERSAHHVRRPERALAPAAETIRADALDALIYPEIGMNPLCIALANLRLAPLQCAAWGHPATTGIRNIDFFLSTAAMEPPDAANHYTERLHCLPGVGTWFSPPTIPDRASRSDLGLPDAGELCLYPHSPFKIHPDNDSVIAEFLQRCPRTTLVMFASRNPAVDRQLRSRLEGRLRRSGISFGERVTVLPRVGRATYLQINLACDLMLDALHFSGGHSTIDALACGLPIVACPGEFMRGRQTAAMLRQIQLEELIADAPPALAELAERLCRDVEWNRAIRRRLAVNGSSLFQQSAPIRALEEFLIDRCRSDDGA